MNVLHAVGDCFYNGTVFHAVNSERLDRETQEAQTMGVVRRFFEGVKSGVTGFIPKVIYSEVISAGYSRCGVSSKISVARVLKASPHRIPVCFENFVLVIVIAPLIEEVICRLVLQNVIRGFQYLMSSANPTDEELHSQRSFRILCANSLFAALHLSNASHSGNLSAYSQATTIALNPRASILYETHGFSASLGYHMANNAMVYVLIALVSAAVQLLQHKK